MSWGREFDLKKTGTGRVCDEKGERRGIFVHGPKSGWDVDNTSSSKEIRLRKNVDADIKVLPRLRFFFRMRLRFDTCRRFSSFQLVFRVKAPVCMLNRFILKKKAPVCMLNWFFGRRRRFARRKEAEFGCGWRSGGDAD